jgi:hypothetical protein
MASNADLCTICSKAWSISWPGIPFCLRCLDISRQIGTGKPQPPLWKVGSSASEDILARYGVQCAIAGKSENGLVVTFNQTEFSVEAPSSLLAPVTHQ